MRPSCDSLSEISLVPEKYNAVNDVSNPYSQKLTQRLNRVITSVIGLMSAV